MGFLTGALMLTFSFWMYPSEPLSNDRGTARGFANAFMVKLRFMIYLSYTLGPLFRIGICKEGSASLSPISMQGRCLLGEESDESTNDGVLGGANFVRHLLGAAQ